MKAKEARLEEEHLEKKRERITTLWKSVSVFRRSSTTPREFFPTVGAIIGLPHISEILDGDDDEVFEELNKSIAEQLPGITDQIRKNREEALLKLLPPGYTSPEPLKLATTWFSNSLVLRTARVEDVINELWNITTREAWDRVSVNGGINWGSVAPRITFEKKVMVEVTKLITNLGVGDPEKVTAEELDNVPCRIVIFTKKQRGPALSMEVGNWRNLVSVFPSHTHKTSRVSLLWNRYRRLWTQSLESPAGGFSKIMNSRMSHSSVRPPTSCGIAYVVGGQGRIVGLKHRQKHEIIYWMREF